MRGLYILILLVLLAALAIFAFQNREMVSIHYLDRTVASPLALVIGGAYFLGMLTGWTVVGIFRHTVRRAAERPRD